MTSATNGVRRLLAPGLAVTAVTLAVVGCGTSRASGCGELEYEGNGVPDFIVTSDLPFRGPSRTQAFQINDAIRAELRTRAYRAGPYAIGFKACDDSTDGAGASDPAQCSANANDYADDDQVIGVIGPLDSRCAAILIPVLNRAPNGGIPIVSPTNTYPCLTRGGAGCDASEPDKYYPSGARNYLRVVGNDMYQGAAIAELARDLGVARIYLLHDNEAYGVGIAENVRRAAESLGLEVVGSEGWDPEGTSYVPLFEKVRESRADAVFLGGFIDQNGGQVIRDKVAVLGRNDGAVKLLAPDGFAVPRTSEDAGSAADGMFVSGVGVPYLVLPDVAKGFAADHLGGEPVAPNAIHGAQAARVMLDAIAKSDGTRGDVTAKLFETKVTDGLLGSFAFDASGDPVEATGAVVGFTIFVVDGALHVERTIDPAPATVRAAVGPTE